MVILAQPLHLNPLSLELQSHAPTDESNVSILRKEFGQHMRKTALL